MPLLLVAAVVLLAPEPRRVRQLPPGTLVLTGEMAIGSDTDLRGAPSGTVLRAADTFRGRALIVCAGRRIRLSGFTVDGNRAALEQPSGLPPYDKPFAAFTSYNGVLADVVSDFEISNVRFREVAGFAVVVSRSSDVAIQGVTVQDSGGRNSKGRNNTSGGILLEEGTSHFRVANCTMRGIRGNGIWTHSLYTSPRNGPGLIAGNRFDTIGRDAIQVGHAVDVRVIENSGSRIGFPTDAIDVEGGGVPVAIDTAGNVERSVYSRNRFDQIEGKCIDLDGFHDGEVRDNVCVDTGNFGIVMNNSNPDMQSRGIRIVRNEVRGALFGGIFAIGSGHTLSGNRLLDLNRAGCGGSVPHPGCSYGPDEPDLLRSGIYLGRGAERPAIARDNTVEDNEISGYGMSRRCIGLAPGVSRASNVIRGNRCSDTR